MNTHDDTLRRSLHEAAARFALPSQGPEQILEVARSASRKAPHDAGDRSSAPRWSRRRITMVAAVAVVLTALAGSLSLGLGDAKRTVQLGASGGLQRATPSGLPNSSAKDFFGVGLSGRAGSVMSVGAKGPTSTSHAASQQTKVVSVGAVSLTVAGNRFGAVVTRITNAAIAVGGYVASSKVTGGTAGPGTAGTIELRVPQKQFSAVVAEVEHMGHLVSVVTNSTDVTGQYVDFQSRIGALQVSRSQYLAIMARASSIGDILAIQAQVNVIESQIEQLEGQRNLLVNQAALATLDVSINQAPATSHSSGFHKAWSQSISGFVGGVEALIRAAGPAFFALLCLAALLLLGRFGWRASQRRLI